MTHPPPAPLTPARARGDDRGPWTVHITSPAGVIAEFERTTINLDTAGSRATAVLPCGLGNTRGDGHTLAIVAGRHEETQTVPALQD